jgi:hypothetical protein
MKVEDAKTRLCRKESKGLAINPTLRQEVSEHGGREDTTAHIIGVLVGGRGESELTVSMTEMNPGMPSLLSAEVLT